MARTKDIIARQGILASIANESGELQLENSIYHFTLDTIPLSRCKVCRLILFVLYKPSKSECDGKVDLLHKKWSFSLSVSSLTVTKSAVSYGSGHIYWRNP